MKKLLFLLIIFFLIFLFSSNVFAQTRYNIGLTSPILLGLVYDGYAEAMFNPFVALPLIDFSMYHMFCPYFGVGLRCLSCLLMVNVAYPSMLINFEWEKVYISFGVGGLLLVSFNPIPTSLPKVITQFFPFLVVETKLGFKVGKYFSWGAGFDLVVAYYTTVFSLSAFIRWTF